MTDAERVQQLHTIVQRLWLALAYYGDPQTYFAIDVLSDPPCGDFVNDFGTTEVLDREVPGKRARETLEKLCEQYPAVLDEIKAPDELFNGVESLLDRAD